MTVSVNSPNQSSVSPVYVYITDDYEAGILDTCIGVRDTAALRSITMPDPTAYPIGQKLTIKDETGSGGGKIKLLPYDSETFDGAADYMFPDSPDGDDAAIEPYTDGINWHLT